MTKHTVSGHCDFPECGETFETDAEERDVVSVEGVAPHIQRFPGAMPDGWRHVQVREVTRKHTHGDWLDLCPSCAAKLAWMLPKEAAQDGLEVRHVTGIGPIGE